MSREKLTYRDNLVELKELYPDKQVLKMPDVKELTGIQKHETLIKDKRLAECGFSKRGGRYSITVAGMARYLS